MRDRQTCIDCGKLSPQTETNYTLISSQFGWRLNRWRAADGSFHVEWRCPDCWRDHKRVKQAEPAPASQGPASSPRPPLESRPLPSFQSARPPPPSRPVGPLPPLPRPPLPRTPRRAPTSISPGPPASPSGPPSTRKYNPR